MRHSVGPFESVDGLLVGFEVVTHHQFPDKPYREELQPKQAQQHAKYQKRSMLNEKLNVTKNLLNEKYQQNHTSRKKAESPGRSKQMQGPEHVPQQKAYGNQVKEHTESARNAVM